METDRQPDKATERERQKNQQHQTDTQTYGHSQADRNRQTDMRHRLMLQSAACRENVDFDCMRSIGPKLRYEELSDCIAMHLSATSVGALKAQTLAATPLLVGVSTR